MELPHVCQRSNWDCGIACVEMILRYFFREKFNNEKFLELCSTLGFDKSTWTIDLVNVLVHCNIVCVFHTITCGVDPGYKGEQYYQKSFESEETRVNKLFENAEEFGLKIVKSSVPLEDIFTKLEQGYVAIVLVDSTKLWCNRCQFWKSIINETSHYCGHYILLCGYNREQNAIIYKNPSMEETQCTTSSDVFESAWHSYGTDDDIIFIDLNIEKYKLNAKFNEFSKSLPSS